MTETEFTALVYEVVSELPAPLQKVIDTLIPIIIDEEITPEIINDIANENPGWKPSD